MKPLSSYDRAIIAAARGLPKPKRLVLREAAAVIRKRGVSTEQDRFLASDLRQAYRRLRDAGEINHLCEAR